MLNPVPIFQFLADAQAQGQACALATIASVDGTSTRNPGSHMGIAEDGRFIGSFSGGCVEGAVVTEARAAIKDGQPRHFRLGKDSPWIDIRLPCGGGIDIAVHPLPDAAVPVAVLDLFAARDSVTLDLPFNGAPSATKGTARRGALVAQDRLTVEHLPPLRIVIIGQGSAVEALHRQARAFGAVTHILSPDEDLCAEMSAGGGPADWLKSPGPCPALALDPWSACVFFFHDHDWEAALMHQALGQPHFYLGAMGSLRTHQVRKALLARLGADADAIARIKAPIGLLRSSRDPEVLALSTLAEIVDGYAHL